jgi:hypothetical protein
MGLVYMMLVFRTLVFSYVARFAPSSRVGAWNSVECLMAFVVSCIGEIFVIEEGEIDMETIERRREWMKTGRAGVCMRERGVRNQSHPHFDPEVPLLTLCMPQCFLGRHEH